MKDRLDGEISCQKKKNQTKCPDGRRACAGDFQQIYIKDFTNQSLLIFKGNSSNLKANSLINILKNNEFAKKYQIESLEFLNKRRWDINLYSDVKIMLSEEDPNKSIQNFIKIQNKLSETDINNIKTYDLRNLKKTILINLND